MKVYLVMVNRHDFQGNLILEVFITKDKAQERVAYLSQLFNGDGDYWVSEINAE